MALSNTDITVPLTEEDVAVADASGAPPVIANFKPFGRIARLEALTTNTSSTLANAEENVAALEAVAKVNYVEVVASDISRDWIYVGENQTVVKIEAKRLAAVNPGAGVADLVVQNSANQTLQSAATSDATALTTSWTELALSATAGRLNLADGLVRIGLNTADAGAGGGPVWFRVTTTPTPA